MGNEPVVVAIYLFLKREKVYHQKMHLIFFLISAENMALLSLNIIKLIPSGPQPETINSPCSPCDYTRVKTHWDTCLTNHQYVQN